MYYVSLHLKNDFEQNSVYISILQFENVAKKNPVDK